MQQTIDKHTYRLLLGAVIVTLTMGTIVYHFSEKFSWVNSYYFSVVTLSTVGYGDYVPHTTFGKIFTTFYIFAGVGIITTFFSATIRRRGHKMKQRQSSSDESE